MALDPAVLSALSALGGSAIGATATLANTWMTGRAQRIADERKAEAAKREALYGDFIAEASSTLADAVSREVEDPAVLVRLHALTSRMRLMSSPAVLHAAEAVIMTVIEAYAAPNRTLRQLREEFGAGSTDPLEGFGEACRLELAALRR